MYFRVAEKISAIKLFSVSFVPDKPGTATVNVKYGDEEVEQCPVYVPVKPDIDTSRVKCSGPGVQKNGKSSNMLALTKVGVYK